MFFFQIAICGWAVRVEGNGGRVGVTEVCCGTINALSCRFAYVFFFGSRSAGGPLEVRETVVVGVLRRVCGGTINVLSCSFMRDLGGWYVIV